MSAQEAGADDGGHSKATKGKVMTLYRFKVALDQIYTRSGGCWVDADCDAFATSPVLWRNMTRVFVLVTVASLH